MLRLRKKLEVILTLNILCKLWWDAFELYFTLTDKRLPLICFLIKNMQLHTGRNMCYSSVVLFNQRAIQTCREKRAGRFDLLHPIWNIFSKMGKLSLNSTIFWTWAVQFRRIFSGIESFRSKVTIELCKAGSKCIVAAREDFVTRRR